MLTNEELTYFIGTLENNDVSEKAITLRTLIDSPCEDERIVPYLESLLNDRSPCLIGIPYHFGEIRWLAANALANERAILGIKEPVRLLKVAKPLSADEVAHAERVARLKINSSGVDGLVESFGELNRRGFLHLVDVVYNENRFGSINYIDCK
ncbi:MAG: hypothetical protein HY819_21060 [Acidobacteria bacterium]|nr:hypothetical protein [Acidobacteriota bacterium]